MSKSVLVIDTPGNCGKCKFISGFWCRAMNDRRVPNNDAIPNWCPLMDLPEKDNGDYPSNTFDAGFAEGRTECIDEITGGEVDGEINKEIR